MSEDPLFSCERFGLGSQFSIGHFHLSSHVKSLILKEFFGIVEERS